MFAWRKVKVNIVRRREEGAANDILGNERMTAGLDDEAARALNNWGLDCVSRIVGNTVTLTDAQAEENMAPKLKATRRMMRIVNRWTRSRYKMIAGENQELLEKILKLAGVIYEEEFKPIDANRLAAFYRYSILTDDNSALVIKNLQIMVEGSQIIPNDVSGGMDDRAA